jgi:hypothetical protein
MDCWLLVALQAAIANLRPATMELGGKSCLIIFDDAGAPGTDKFRCAAPYELWFWLDPAAASEHSRQG